MQEVVGSIPIGSIEFDPSRSYRGGSFDLEHGIALEGKTQYLRYRTPLFLAGIGVTGVVHMFHAGRLHIKVRSFSINGEA